MSARGASTNSTQSLEQEDLDLIKKSVLIHHRQMLVDSVDPQYHLPYLRSKFIINERDSDEIRAVGSRSGQVVLFLDKLGRKGAKGYDEFCGSLCRDKTQLFLLTAMTTTLELLKHRVLDYKVQQAKQAKMQPPTQQTVPSSHSHKPPPSSTFTLHTPHQHPSHNSQHQLLLGTTSTPHHFHFSTAIPQPVPSSSSLSSTLPFPPSSLHNVSFTTPRPASSSPGPHTCTKHTIHPSQPSPPPSSHPHSHYKWQSRGISENSHEIQNNGPEYPQVNEQGSPLNYPSHSDSINNSPHTENVPQFIEHSISPPPSPQEQPCGQPI